MSWLSPVAPRPSPSYRYRDVLGRRKYMREYMRVRTARRKEEREIARQALTETEKKMDWVRYYRASPGRYEMRALIAVFENDGEKMLEEVLKELGLLSGVDLVKDAAKKQ